MLCDIVFHNTLMFLKGPGLGQRLLLLYIIKPIFAGWSAFRRSGKGFRKAVRHFPTDLLHQTASLSEVFWKMNCQAYFLLQSRYRYVIVFDTTVCGQPTKT